MHPRYTRANDPNFHPPVPPFVRACSREELMAARDRWYADTDAAYMALIAAVTPPDADLLAAGRAWYSVSDTATAAFRASLPDGYYAPCSQAVENAMAEPSAALHPLMQKLLDTYDVDETRSGMLVLRNAPCCCFADDHFSHPLCSIPTQDLLDAEAAGLITREFNGSWEWAI